MARYFSARVTGQPPRVDAAHAGDLVCFGRPPHALSENATQARSANGGVRRRWLSNASPDPDAVCALSDGLRTSSALITRISRVAFDPLPFLQLSVHEKLTWNLPGSDSTLLCHRPLRTVRETFASYGSSPAEISHYRDRLHGQTFRPLIFASYCTARFSMRERRTITATDGLSLAEPGSCNRSTTRIVAVCQRLPHLVEVGTLSRPDKSRIRIRVITTRPSLFPPSSTRSTNSFPCGSPAIPNLPGLGDGSGLPCST